MSPLDADYVPTLLLLAATLGLIWTQRAAHPGWATASLIGIAPGVALIVVGVLASGLADTIRKPQFATATGTPSRRTSRI